MPIYEFVCQHCNARFEQLMKSSDTPQALCGRLCKLERSDENFGVGDLQRVISAPAAVARPEFINREGPSTKQMADSGFTVYKKEDPERRIYKKQSGSGPDWVQR
jgi:putative FmdB family regulatory protein